MITNKNLLAIGVVVVCCVTVVWFSTSIQGGSKTYELRPQIAIPEYRTDTARALDAYERLMERYMNLTERNSMRIGTDLKEVMKKLDSINDKLTELSARIARIEKTFGISPAAAVKNPKSPVKKKPQTKVRNEKTDNPDVVHQDLPPW